MIFSFLQDFFFILFVRKKNKIKSKVVEKYNKIVEMEEKR
jgi:hypothetical protein